MHENLSFLTQSTKFVSVRRNICLYNGCQHVFTACQLFPPKITIEIKPSKHRMRSDIEYNQFQMNYIFQHLRMDSWMYKQFFLYK